MDIIRNILGIIASISVIAVNGYKVIKYLRHKRMKD